jgi:hypothetical protein
MSECPSVIAFGHFLLVKRIFSRLFGGYAARQIAYKCHIEKRLNSDCLGHMSKP